MVRLLSYRYWDELTADWVGCADKLLEKEPGNLQARSLGELIDQKLTRGTCSFTFDGMNSGETESVSLQRGTLVWRLLARLRRSAPSSSRPSSGEQTVISSRRASSSCSSFHAIAIEHATSTSTQLVLNFGRCRCGSVGISICICIQHSRHT